MYTRMIRNDLVRNKLISVVTTLFITAAATLIGLVALLTVNLSDSIDGLMEQTKVADFLQMHAGDIDEQRLARFAETNENVKQFQVVEFLNIPGAQIQIGENTLADSAQDNGLATQSPYFDYMLDLDGQVIHPKDGELYVPIGYMRDGTAAVGDKAVIAGKAFTVAGFLRDGQMNSPMASSKRFLVSEADYQSLVDAGTLEYLIEFLLLDASKMNDFETAYADAGLENNGPTGTKSLFKLINGLSDGIMIAVILLVGMLIVVIAFMCIRFTLLTKIEEDYREIGTMKAIGLRVADIQTIYLAKYALLAFIGCLLGVILAIVASEPLLENIRFYMGESQYSGISVLVAVLGSVLVFLLIMGYVRLLLRRFKRISAATAIRTGGTEEKSKRSRLFSLHKNGLLPATVFLGIKDVFSRTKLYMTMLIVLLLSTFIMIVPLNTHYTISDPSFIKQIGFGEMDVLVSMYQSLEPVEREHEVEEYLDDNEMVASYAKIVSKSFKVKQADGTEEKLVVELGDHEAFSVDYMKGRAPKETNEIALSSINADEFKKQVGDTLVLICEDGEKEFTVTGIYSNIFNGGKTAKAAFSDDAALTMWLNYYVKLDDTANLDEAAADISQGLSFAKVSDVHKYREDFFGPTQQSLKLAAGIACGMALFITGLITLLFMKLLIAKDRGAIAMLKAVGFTNKDIAAQYMTSGLFILLIGIIGGNILAATLGESFAGLIVSSSGINGLSFTSHPLIYLGCPIAMFLVTLAATKWGIMQAGNIDMAENLKE